MLKVIACCVVLLLVMMCNVCHTRSTFSQYEGFAPIALGNFLNPDSKITTDINGNKCIDIGIYNRRLDKLTLQECNGQKNQRYWMSPFNGAIRNSQGMCLDIPNNQSGNGVQVQIYDCNNSNAQKFKLVNRDKKTYIQKQGTNFCIDLTNANLANHTPIQLWDCNWTPAQRWQFKK